MSLNDEISRAQVRAGEGAVIADLERKGLLARHVDDGGTAFPYDERDSDDRPVADHFGMTLRDYFAAKAMQAMIACETDGTRAQIAGWAYSQADAMLKERKAES